MSLPPPPHHHDRHGILTEEQILALGTRPDVSLESLLFPEFSEELSSPSDHSTSSPYTSSSPASVLSSPTRVTLEVHLFHKPRGSQGIWQPVTHCEGLRVTKGKGKRLKIKIKCEEPIHKTQLEIGLMDLTDPTPVATKDGFSIENFIEVEDPRTIELEVKLTKYCKRLQFLIFVRTPKSILQSSTVEFGSHNNGKANKPTTEPNVPMFQNTTFQPPPMTYMNSPIDSYTSHFSMNEKKRKEMMPPTSQEERINVVDGPLEVHGVVKAKAFLQFSDLRLKTDITDLLDAVDIVSHLQGKTYQWKKGVVPSDQSGGKRVIGLIAQEVQRVLPEVVHEDPQTGLLSVSYAEIVPVLIEAFKQHLREYKTDQEGVQKQLTDLHIKLEQVEKVNKTSGSRMSQFLTLHPVMVNGQMWLQPTMVSYAPGPSHPPYENQSQPLYSHSSQPAAGVELSYESPSIPQPPRSSAYRSPLRLVGLLLFIAGALLITGAVIWNKMGRTSPPGRHENAPPNNGANAGFITLLVVGLISCVASCVFVCISSKRPSEVLRNEPIVPYMHVGNSPRVSSV